MSDKAWIQELRKLAEKATGGITKTTWKYENERVTCWSGTIADLRYRRGHLDGPYIAAASPDRILELIGMVEEQGRRADIAVGCLEVKDQLNETLRQREQELVRERDAAKARAKELEGQLGTAQLRSRMLGLVDGFRSASESKDRAEAAEAPFARGYQEDGA